MKLRTCFPFGVVFLLFVSCITLGGSPRHPELKPGMNKVHFLSEKTHIAGHLFLPDNYSTRANYRAIVVVTPNSGIKEQTAGIYAEKLAKQGYVTLAFDHRTYGESGGYPRAMENGSMKVEDIKTAVSYIGAVSGVNKNRLAVLGICSGAGYSIQTAFFDTRIKAVATVSAFIDFIDYGEGGGHPVCYSSEGYGSRGWGCTVETTDSLG